ncbi:MULTISPECIES: hypothetical protein [unclassified Leifsonia]|uniref:hypothetical protein n=1 Tax=unclassified Leifsonia TaxID=2663824 RepID=UPI0006F3400D|nr:MULTISPECIES: hypothetical protein [unclassified Leifsonia]KQX07393.1 hypothetical protein ASC59_06380 [Leifsonia sp. Root1293]KRA11675.1 hypothetical protein ASD61_06380 [Leifsonia sp. Root60]
MTRLRRREVAGIGVGGMGDGRGPLIVAVIALAASVLSGCSGAAPPPSASPPSFSAEAAIVQGRTDYTRGVFSMAITNTGDGPLTIVDAAYTSPRFAEAAERTGESVTLAAGQRIDLRSPIPPLACDSAAADGTGEIGTIELMVTDGSPDAEPTELSLVPTDPNNTVDRLLREGCLVNDVDDVVAIAPPTALRVDGSGADAEAFIDLTLTPTGGTGSATFTGVRSTTLMSPADGADGWPLGFTADAASAVRDITLPMRPTRCDPHALADDKVGTVLVIDATTSTGREGRYLLPLPPTVKAEVYEYITTVCGD